MKRKLHKQILNEWRSNLWLAVELLIISVVIWYVLVSMISTIFLHADTPGYDATGVYVISHNIYQDGAALYDASRGDADAQRDDFVEILSRLRRAPGVEALAVSSNAVPYNYNTNGGIITMAPKDTTSYESVSLMFATKNVSASYPMVMDIHGINGETPEELAAFIREKNGRLVTANTFDYTESVDYNTPERLGEDWEMIDDDGTVFPLKVVTNQQRNDYEPAFYPVVFLQTFSEESPWNYDWINEITVRVDPMRRQEFVDWMKEKTGDYLKSGNVYVNDLTSVENIREDNQREIREMISNRLTIIGFLMMSIFLGLLGAFWFRTQARIGEIAIRKVNGATPSQIFRRLMGEGLLILTAVTPLAIFFDWILVKVELVFAIFGQEIPMWVYTESAAGSYLLTALAVVLGIWFPAHRAMKVDPARALADE